jgi:hypothetical protein
MEYPAMPSQQVTVRLPANMLVLLDELAHRFACNRLALLRCVVHYVTAHPELARDLRAICAPLSQVDTRTDEQRKAQEVYFQELPIIRLGDVLS